MAAHDPSFIDSAQRSLYAAQALDALLQASPVAIVAVDIEGRLTIWNPAAEQMFGWRQDEVLGLPNPVVQPEKEAEYRQMYGRVLKGERITAIQVQRQRKDGSLIDVSVSAVPLRDRQGKVIGSAAFVTDITEARRAEERLRNSEQRYRFLFENNPHPMWVCDLQTLAFLNVNDAAVRLYGYSREEFLGMTIKDIRPPEDIPALLQQLKDLAPHLGLRQPGIWRHRTRHGTILDIEITSFTFALGEQKVALVLANDITERKRIEEQLRQTQKLEAIGRLAGGVAHDFNNILGVIVGYTYLMLSSTPETDPLHEMARQVANAAHKANSLTRQLLAFSRKQVLQPKVICLNDTIAGMEEMLSRLIGEDIELKLVLAPGSTDVKADPGQIEQLVMNLVVNARDAMPDGGKLTIETSVAELDEDAVRALGVEPGKFVVLAVSDSGQGMNAEIRARVFEPFFTTKEPGKGTGLGLATVHGIVTQSHGCISVRSEPGLGTTFTICLPCEDAGDQLPQLPKPVQVVPQGTETILLVEDAPALRGLVSQILTANGYMVLQAADGAEAIEIAARSGAMVDVLLTDIVMPNMRGPELAARLSPRYPEMKVIYMSGYAEDVFADDGALTAAALVEKPFQPPDLLRVLREVLEKP